MRAVKTLLQLALLSLCSPLINALNPNRDAKHPSTLHPDTHGGSSIRNTEAWMEDALTDISSSAGRLHSCLLPD